MKATNQNLSSKGLAETKKRIAIFLGDKENTLDDMTLEAALQEVILAGGEVRWGFYTPEDLNRVFLTNEKEVKE